MTNVANAISALLYDHNVVIVPGLGAFLCQADGAKVNVITNQFEKPSATLGFDPQRREDNDLVVGYLTAHDDITVAEARQQVMKFVSETYACLKDGGQVEIPFVGTLAFDGNQEIVFSPVDSNDFNGDAFGLADMQPQPIYTSESQDDWKEQVTQQLKDLNTPMTVDIDHDGKKPKRGWIWIVLLLLLIVGGVALWYFKFRPVTPPQPNKPGIIDTVKPVGIDTVRPVEIDTVRPVALDTVMESDTMALPIDTAAVEIVKPAAEIKAFIVGGCFSIEQNATNMVNDTKELGCSDAFVMKRGSMYYVCYGGYATTAEAKGVLPEIWKKYNSKAWILTK